jgi:phosphoribosylaminoimidazolecarboxamide formyltransferase / IMP cyclohydrolase
MSESNDLGLVRIRRALISVSDKTGLVEFARALKGFGVEIISTGGTAKTLRDAGIEVRDVSEVTGFPEMMDGRIKTLHPRIHGALLSVRDNPEHIKAMSEHGIEPIDMVVINLYPFEETIARKNVTLEEAIEQIDIGGPAMIRSAAKNFRSVAIVVSPEGYDEIISELGRQSGALALDTREDLASSAFVLTSAYDSAISQYFHARHAQMFVREKYEAAKGRPIADGGESEGQPEIIHQLFTKITDLRYGENPHQAAAIYDVGEEGGVTSAAILSGKEMSFNNYVDADAAWQLVCDFDQLTCAIIKHTNPSGVALGATAEEAYQRALATDPVSAFGGIVAFNREIDEPAARAVVKIFTEVVIAPGYTEAALDVLRARKNLRILRANAPTREYGTGLNYDYKKISGGMLLQTRDTRLVTKDELRVVTNRAPTGEEIDDLLFAWTVCKHTKSNAIVYARDGQTVGVGAGQMSRVDSVKLGAMRAQLPVKGSVLASDAFFPFRDGIDEAAKHGITAVIQPGGSVRDDEVIAAASEQGLAMVFTGVRHFKH